MRTGNNTMAIIGFGAFFSNQVGTGGIDKVLGGSTAGLLYNVIGFARSGCAGRRINQQGCLFERHYPGEFGEKIEIIADQHPDVPIAGFPNRDLISRSKAKTLRETGPGRKMQFAVGPQNPFRCDDHRGNITCSGILFVLFGHSKYDINIQFFRQFTHFLG